MNIIPIKAYTDNYIWALLDKDASSFSCVDPGDATPVLNFAKQQKLQLDSILITHHHSDHIGGVKKLKEIYPSCRVYAPEDDRIPEVTQFVNEESNVQLGPFTIKVLSTPGHTSKHISYLELNTPGLFCGDTLFSGGCGRVFDGTLLQLHDSLQQFTRLSKTVLIYCAHEYTRQNLRYALHVEPDNEAIKNHLDYLMQDKSICSLPSSLEKELLINPFLRTEVPQVQEFALKYGATSKTSLEVFRVLREQKNDFK